MAEYDLGKYGATIELDTSKFDKGMSAAEKGMDNTEKKAKGFSKILGGLATTAIAGLSTAVVGFVGVGVKVFNDLDTSLRNLQAQTGATDAEMKGMEESLENIYASNYGESFDDIAQAMATVKQNTGLVGQELEETTKNAITLRDTFGMDVTESTRAAKSMIEQFGISAEQAYNLIAQGAQNGANKNGDLLDTLNEYAVQFSALGFSAEEFTNILIDGAENGAWSIDKVGDAIKEFNIRAKDMSATTLDAFSSLGLDAEEMSQAFAQGGDSAQKAFQQVMTALSNMDDPLEKNRIGVQLFGTMFEDLEAEAISAFANIGDKASLSKNALEQINQVKYDSFGSAIQGIYRSIQIALIDSIQEHVLPLLNRFASFIQSNMPQIQAIFGAVFSVIGSIFNGFVQTIGFVISIIQSFVSSTNSSFSGVRDTISTILGTIMTIITDILNIISSLWQTHGEDIINKVTEYTNSVFSIFKSLWDNYLNPFIETALTMFKEIWNKHLKGLITEVVSFVTNLATSAMEIYSKFIAPIINWLIKLFAPSFQNTFSIIFGVVGTLLSTVSDVAKGVLKIFGGIIDFITGVFTGNWKKAWEGVKKIFKGVFDSLYGIVKFPINLIIKGINTLISGLNKISFDVPDWVPVIGGKEFGFNIPKIPELATGGIVDKPTLAWIGEGRDREMVMPLNSKAINPFVDAVYKIIYRQNQ